MRAVGEGQGNVMVSRGRFGSSDNSKGHRQRRRERGKRIRGGSRHVTDGHATREASRAEHESEVLGSCKVKGQVHLSSAAGLHHHTCIAWPLNGERRMVSGCELNGLRDRTMNRGGFERQRARLGRVDGGLKGPHARRACINRLGRWGGHGRRHAAVACIERW